MFFNYVYGEEQFQKVIVAEPFLEVHTGYGKSYPVFHIIERGETIEIIFRHTSWFKIRSHGNIEGWVSAEEIALTLSPNLEPVEFKSTTVDDYKKRKWEFSILGGRFGGANALSLNSTYVFNNDLTTEFSGTKAVGNNSSSNIYKIAILMHPFTFFSTSPYVFLASGVIITEAKTTLIQPIDSSNQFSNFGLGIRSYLSKRVLARLEYSNYVIFSADQTNDKNEGINEWKAGFSLFF